MNKLWTDWTSYQWEVWKKHPWDECMSVLPGTSNPSCGRSRDEPVQRFSPFQHFLSSYWTNACAVFIPVLVDGYSSYPPKVVEDQNPWTRHPVLNQDSTHANPHELQVEYTHSCPHLVGDISRMSSQWHLQLPQELKCPSPCRPSCWFGPSPGNRVVSAGAVKVQSVGQRCHHHLKFLFFCSKPVESYHISWKNGKRQDFPSKKSIDHQSISNVRWSNPPCLDSNWLQMVGSEPWLLRNCKFQSGPVAQGPRRDPRHPRGPRGLKSIGIMNPKCT